MLARLRHHTLVGRDDQHRQVDPADAGQHVLDEALVPRDVDDLDREPTRLLEERESEIDRDAAGLLFGKTVGVGAGQRLDQRGLAVVDVPGGTDDDVRGDRRRAHRRVAASVSASARSPTWAGSTVRQSSSRRSCAVRPTTGGSPPRSASSSRIVASELAPTATAAVGSSTVGKAPPPTFPWSSTTLAAR